MGYLYQPDDKVCGPRWDWLAYLLCDIGVKGDRVDERVQKAVEKYVVGYLEDSERFGGSEITMGELESRIHTFWDGYEQAYVDLGSLEARSDAVAVL